MVESPDGDTWDVVPFERVGPIELGATKRDVLRLLKEDPFYTSVRGPITTEVFRDAGADVEFDLEALGHTVHRSEGGVVVPDLGLRCFIEEGVVTGVMGVRRDYAEVAPDVEPPEEADDD